MPVVVNSFVGAGKVGEARGVVVLQEVVYRKRRLFSHAECFNVWRALVGEGEGITMQAFVWYSALQVGEVLSLTHIIGFALIAKLLHMGMEGNLYVAGDGGHSPLVP